MRREMTERRSEPDQRAVPQDMATLYSRAHKQGTSYGDFFASRNDVRGQFRQRTVRKPVTQPAAVPSRQVEEQIQAIEEPQLSRPTEAVSTRWYALQSAFSPVEIAEEPAQVSLEGAPPVLSVLSLAGGVGKTCLVATLGRALAALGERVLLADTAVCGLLPFYFGSREFRPGVVRTFSPPASAPGSETDAPVHVLNLQAERYPAKGREHDTLLGELLRDGRGTSRILVDVATASREVTSRLLLLRPTVLVPVLPDMSSVASLGLLQVLLADEDGVPSATVYLLNQFDASVRLHVDVRAALQEQMGDRLLPFVLRRSSAVSEALADGMTVIDYAPDSEAAEDYRSLAGWLRTFVPPAAVGDGGVRWSER
jgi:cellulose synthase operon protein YhjQ